ncbi:MAG TPA: KH domain-containing protein [archaeon]|nr:KH domain-containing protein [archaeon]
MSEARIHIKIPYDRVGILIGPEGIVKQEIEKKCGVELKINSESGDIEVILKTDQSDPAILFKAENVINAVGRGFSPAKALNLLDDDVIFEVIDLREAVGKSKSELERVKGRLIGEKGKTRRIIEETSGAKISIYGHTIAIIGETEQLEVAKQAIEMLIKGSQHGTVYRYLHRKRGELKKAKLTLWETPEEGAHE